MKYKLRYRREVPDDIRAARDWYRKDSPTSAVRFLHDLDGVLQRIRSSPEQFGLVYDDVRFARVPDSHYVVHFFVTRTHVVISGVWHERRDLAESKRRLEGD